MFVQVIMDSIRNIVVAPVRVDPVTRIKDEDHATRIVDFDPNWGKEQLYLAVLSAA